jgi:flagellar hook-associated protein 1 FlgK
LQVSVVGGLSVITAQTAGATLNLTGGSIAGAMTIRDGPLATLFNNVNNLASQLITQVNSIYSAGYDLNGNTGQPFFTGATAADIAVNGVVANDPSKFQAAGAPGAPGDNSVALALAQLGNRSSVALGGQTFSQNYSQTVAGLGQSLANVNDNIANNGTIMQMLNNQRASVSGVSIDEEMTSLMQFQKAYQASAELVSTVNSMLATVIAMKTV